MKTITIRKNIRIPGTDIILEKGDRISLIPKKLCEFDNEFLNLYESQFSLNSLSDKDFETLYTNFYNSYTQSVGSALNRDDFIWKGSNWTFFGNINGGIALRAQNSGLYKLNACYGNPRDILNGIKEMQSTIGNSSIWGAMTDNIAIMLEKATKHDGDKKFKRVPDTIAKHLTPYLTGLFGSEVKANSDGTLEAKTPDGKSIQKVLIANKVYFKWLLSQAEENSDKLPIPKAILPVLIGALKLFLKIW